MSLDCHSKHIASLRVKFPLWYPQFWSPVIIYVAKLENFAWVWYPQFWSPFWSFTAKWENVGQQKPLHTITQPNPRSHYTIYIYILVYTILICIILPLWLILQPLTHQKLSTVEAHQNIRSAVSENVSLRRFSGPLVSYPSADSGHGLLQHHLEKLWKSGNTAETN